MDEKTDEELLREFAVDVICMPRPVLQTDVTRKLLQAIIYAALDAIPALKVSPAQLREAAAAFTRVAGELETKQEKEAV